MPPRTYTTLPDSPVGEDPKHFTSVKEARAQIRARALEIFDKLIATADSAAASDKPEVAIKAYQWVLEHTKDEDGSRAIDAGVDSQKQLEAKPTGPLVHINLKLGATETPKQLPAEPALPIIDVTPEKVE